MNLNDHNHELTSCPKHPDCSCHSCHPTLTPPFVCPSLITISHAISDFFASQGFESPSHISQTDVVAAKLMMVVTELAEAMEAVRDGNELSLREELADTMIRILHLCGSMNIDIAHEVSAKMAVNSRRPPRHGRKTGV